MNILLTGPTGFIGVNFLRQALNRGHGVAALLLPSEVISSDLQAQANLRIIVGTLADPPWPQIQSFVPDSCLHTAWITTPGVYLESPENDRFLEWSIQFAEKFFANGGQYFMGLGSCAEYQPARQPLAEDASRLNDSTRYARCKTALRLALAQLAAQHHCQAGWGRVFYPFGVGEHPARLCTTLITKIARGEPVVLKTPESTKDYIYIDDLATAILTALEHRFAGALNLGTGRGVTVRHIAKLIGTHLRHPELISAASQPLADPLDYMVADIAKLRSLGWQETVGFAAGLHRLCEHLLLRLNYPQSGHS